MTSFRASTELSAWTSERKQDQQDEILTNLLLTEMTPLEFFYQLCATQKCQFCQLCLRSSCAISNELDQWSLQPWNVILIYPLTLIFTFSDIIWQKMKKEIANCGNTKLAIIPILPILCVYKNLDWPRSRLMWNLNSLWWALFDGW